MHHSVPLSLSAGRRVSIVRICAATGGLHGIDLQNESCSRLSCGHHSHFGQTAPGSCISAERYHRVGNIHVISSQKPRASSLSMFLVAMAIWLDSDAIPCQFDPHLANHETGATHPGAQVSRFAALSVPGSAIGVETDSVTRTLLRTPAQPDDFRIPERQTLSCGVTGPGRQILARATKIRSQES
jgi:hypothetical protein